MLLKKIRNLPALLVLLGMLVFPLTAEETILSFNSDVIVGKDASLLVTETIVVNAEGAQIRHGIFRDFPTRYKTAEGLNYRVSFEIVRVERDGGEEKWSTGLLGNGVRIYIGDKHYYVPAGRHTYGLTYRTKGQIGFFKDHDELYWNVTGNGWTFPIESASCKVRLPEGARQNAIKTGGFTGPFGSKAKNFSCSFPSENIPIFFTTTRPLKKNEGLTILVGFNKGVLAEPTEAERFLGRLKDNMDLILMLAGLIIILAYYFFFWFRYGRDPKKGVIVPRFEPPKGVSAAGMRYMVRMGFDNETFAAALVSMAVKGYLTISKEGEYYQVKGKNEDISLLSSDEKFLAKDIPDLKYWFVFDNKKAATIKTMIADFKAELAREYENRYFITNYKYTVPGIIISLVCVLTAGISSALSEGSIQMLAFMFVWLSLWTLGVIALGAAVFSAWKKAVSGGLTGLGGAVFITLFSVPFFAGEVFGCFMLVKATSVFFLVFFLLALALNALFYYLLKAPTLLGRKALDEIEGFKRFLSVSEKESLDYAVKINQALYEKFLPYAMALGVEKKWSEKFAETLAAAGEEKAVYRPGWYTGAALGAGFYAGSFASDFSGSFNSAVSAASTPPGSSSGFSGGGGSGGGGGGGGGGGW